MHVKKLRLIQRAMLPCCLMLLEEGFINHKRKNRIIVHWLMHVEKVRMKRALYAIMLISVLVSMLTSSFSLQSVKASGTLYIRADGSIDPPTAPISTADNVTYTLTDDINGSINVERDNIVVDGANCALRGIGDFGTIGISIIGGENATVKRLEVRGFYYGIYLDGSSYCSIVESSIVGNYWLGLRLINSSNNAIVGNNVTNSDYGIYLSASPSNTIQSNRMDSNTYNFLVDGSLLSHFVNEIDVSNTVNGRPVYYRINETDKGIPLDAGYVALVNCTRMSVHSLSLSENGQGMLLAYTKNSTIAGNCIAGNDYGITLLESNDNAVENNTIECRNGIWLVRNSSRNSIFGNNVMNGGRGIFLYDSSDNKIYHNSFVNNTLQVQDARSIDPNVPQSINIWDNGYPSGGNYWSDYTGADLLSGAHQNETGSDGIGDTPYIINEDNRDEYPFVVHDIAVSNVSTSKSGCLPMPIVCQGYTAKIFMTVANHGNVPETFNVTVYATNATNSYIIGKVVNATLNQNESTILTLAWNTTGWSRGNYTVSAVADTVSEEVHTEDNVFVDDVVEIVLAGDVCPTDGYVGIDDIFNVATHFGRERGDPGYDPNKDITDDDYLGIDDIFIAASHFGQEE